MFFPDIVMPMNDRALGVLLAALFSLFLFQGDRNNFLHGHHGFVSSHGLALSANLSSEHRFLMFNAAKRNPDGSVFLDVYNRFPPGAFAAIRIATRPVAGSLPLQVFAARQLMTLFLAAAAVAAFLAACRLGADPWAAAAGTLFAFSSHYCLYYGDLIFNDVPSLFGIVLVVHGLATGSHVNAKIAVALALGWQVFALLLPFVFLSRQWRVGVFALALGGAILAANLANEAAQVGGPLAELPSVQSALRRLGAREAGDEAAFEWGAFAREQLHRVGRMCVPHALGDAGASYWPLGVAAVGIALAVAGWSRDRALLASLVLSGVVWALALRRYVAIHDFQSMFYIGIPLVAWVGAASLARRAAPALAFAAALVFVVSVGRMNVSKSEDTAAGNRLTAEFQRVAERLGTGRHVYVAGPFESMGGAHHAVAFFLAGNTFESELERSDYVLSASLVPGLVSLTPDNRSVHLYPGGKFPAALALFRANDPRARK